MANQLGAPGTSPRCYKQHLRHGLYARVRHAKQFLKFLTVEGAREHWSPAPASGVAFEFLKTYTAQKLKTLP